MKALTRLGAALSLVTLGTLGACQSTQDEDRFFRTEEDRWSASDKMMAYLKDTGYDFCDIFTLDLGWGKTANGEYHDHFYAPILANWIFINVHLTKYLEVGYGNWSGYKVGMIGRGMGLWREENYDGGFNVGLVQNYSVDMTRVPSRGNSQLASRYLDAHGYDIDLDKHNHWTDFGASLYFFILPGFDVNVSPYEALDFVWGTLNNYPNPVELTGHPMPWDIGTDIADDDTRPSTYDPKHGRNRFSSYSIWPTIWPTTFGHHEEFEGVENGFTPTLSPATGSVGGAYGGDKAHR